MVLGRNKIGEGDRLKISGFISAEIQYHDNNNVTKILDKNNEIPRFSDMSQKVTLISCPIKIR